ncbi:MAG: hypothetical protein WBA93_13610 [Microcoleaceae cyanobacterium]
MHNRAQDYYTASSDRGKLIKKSGTQNYIAQLTEAKRKERGLL